MMIIFANPLFQFGKNDHQLEILDNVMKGKKIGCICITEKYHGSDAVNMETQIEEKEDHVIVNGEMEVL